MFKIRRGLPCFIKGQNNKEANSHLKKTMSCGYACSCHGHNTVNGEEITKAIKPLCTCHDSIKAEVVN